MEKLEDWKKSINRRISSGLDETLFKSLKEYIFDETLRNTIISLQSRFNDLQKEKSRGILRSEELEVKKNQIIASLIELTSSLKESDRKPSLINNDLKSRIIKDDDLERMLRIYQKKKELESQKSLHIYKKEFLNFRNKLQSKLDKHCDKGLLNYTRERVYWLNDTDKPLSERMFLGYKYNIEEVTLSLNLCPMYFSIAIETIKDREKYKFKTPESLKLTVNDSEEFVWTENILNINNSEGTKHSTEEIVSGVISDIVKWLCYEKYRERPIKLTNFSNEDFKSFGVNSEVTNKRTRSKLDQQFYPNK